MRLQRRRSRHEPVEGIDRRTSRCFGLHRSQKTVNAAQAVPQSQMKIALGHLELSKAALERATVDKGGHRLRAIELTEDAIAQVRQVVDSDTR